MAREGGFFFFQGLNELENAKCRGMSKQNNGTKLKQWNLRHAWSQKALLPIRLQSEEEAPLDVKQVFYSSQGLVAQFVSWNMMG